MNRDLGRLLRPKSIAIVGGGAWGASVIVQCRKMGFTGDLWAVHPKRAEVEGVPTVPEITDLPGVPDAVFLGVNRVATVAAVAQLSRMGAGGAVCFASGFLEAQAESGDGADLQEQLLSAAGEMPVLGPNCYGFINYLDGALLWPDQHGGQRAVMARICRSNCCLLPVRCRSWGRIVTDLSTIWIVPCCGRTSMAGRLARAVWRS